MKILPDLPIHLFCSERLGVTIQELRAYSRRRAALRRELRDVIYKKLSAPLKCRMPRHAGANTGVRRHATTRSRRNG
jgi:hypothetical protein